VDGPAAQRARGGSCLVQCTLSCVSSRCSHFDLTCLQGIFPGAYAEFLK
jgi:hypothetical protein